MASVTVKTAAGADAGSMELDESFFGIQPNVPVMHQVVTAQLAARRAGTQSTKTRAEVSGGGKKPFKQKGTGNARQGSTRAPHFSGGGVALGPKPRSYSQKTPKKMVRLALRSALSDRAAEGKVIVLEEWGFSAPKTKDAIAALAKIGVSGKALVVVDIDDTNTIKSFLNLQQVQLIERAELNAYDVLCNEFIVFTKATLPSADGAQSAASTGSTSTAATAEAATSAKAKPAKAKPATDKPAPDKPATGSSDGASTDDATTTAAHGFADLSATTSEVSERGELPAGAAWPLDNGDAPEGYSIKGNAGSGLYHRPGTAFYNRTVAEFWFRSADEAEAAGFQLPPSQRGEADTASSSVQALVDLDEPTADKIGDGSGSLPKGAVEASEDGTSPYKSYTIKGNSQSGYYHTTESPYYERTKAEFWFKTEDAAREAGFEVPPSLRDDETDGESK